MDAAGWRLGGMTLEWETDTAASGMAQASPSGDSYRIPLATNDLPCTLTRRLRATGAAAIKKETWRCGGTGTTGVPPVEERNLSHPNRFVAMHPSDYVIDNVCVTNMDAEVFTFAVENSEKEHPGRFALVKFSEGGLFMYAVYVNLATGEADLEFFAVSGAHLLVAQDLLFPFLDRRECRYQKAIIKRIKGDRKKE